MNQEVVNTIVIILASFSCFFSLLATIIAIYSVIRIKAQDLSKHTFIPVEEKDMFNFESDVDKVNEELEDEEADEYVSDMMGEKKNNKRIII